MRVRCHNPRGRERLSPADRPDQRAPGRGWWQAVIPEPNGEQVITRYTLGHLLDKLDELTGG